PGLFALGEEVIAAGEVPATGGKRMLALFQIAEAEDLGMALGRLFLPGSPLCERFASSRCFVRYAVIEDNIQRRAAHTAFKQWMSSSAEAAWGGIDDIAMPPALLREASQAAENKDRNSPSGIDSPAPLPSGF